LGRWTGAEQAELACQQVLAALVEQSDTVWNTQNLSRLTHLVDLQRID
jgi:hypothetical protein